MTTDKERRQLAADVAGLNPAIASITGQLVDVAGQLAQPATGTLTTAERKLIRETWGSAATDSAWWAARTAVPNFAPVTNSPTEWSDRRPVRVPTAFAPCSPAPGVYAERPVVAVSDDFAECPKSPWG